MGYMKNQTGSYRRLKLILATILLVPILSVSQNSNNLLPKWIKFDKLDAVVISIPQMDTISVRLLERKWYKKKVESNKYRFDLLILEIESLTYQLDYHKDLLKSKNLIITEKDFQIKTLKEQRVLDELNKPTFWTRAKDWILAASVGFVTAFILLN